MVLRLKPDAERERPACLAAVDECGLWAFPIRLCSEGFRCSLHHDGAHLSDTLPLSSPSPFFIGDLTCNEEIKAGWLFP